MARQPTAKELTALRSERFGTDVGAVQLDVNVRTGETTLVYVDGSGAEVAREPWEPDSFQLADPATPNVLMAPGTAPAEVYKADRRLYLDAAGRVVTGDDPSRAGLLVATGSSLPASDARRYGLLDDEGNRLEPWAANPAVKGAEPASGTKSGGAEEAAFPASTAPAVRDDAERTLRRDANRAAEDEALGSKTSQASGHATRDKGKKK